MASVGHVAVGLAAARLAGPSGALSARAAAAWSALSLLPDVDVLGFAVGIPYAHPWGHRGATHSVVLSVALGVAVGLAARRRKHPFGRTTLFTILVVTSHPLLDMMTDGGLGCALFWPFDPARYFAPWRPIPVAPIGFSFFSHGGLSAATELMLFAPLLAFALRRPGTATLGRIAFGAFLLLWVLSCWLIVSGDPVRDAVIGRVLREDTEYSAGFTERGFRTIRPGDSEADVRRLLGTPVTEGWFYAPRDDPSSAAEGAAAAATTCVAINFEHGLVVKSLERQACEKRGIAVGLTRDQVTRTLGRPRESCWRYTRSPRGARSRMRMVCFTEAKVAAVFRRWE